MASDGADTTIELRIRLSSAQAERLNRLAQDHQLDEGRVIGKALDILFSLTDLFNTQAERRGWSYLSEEALGRVWNNEEDAIYDNWRELYAVPEP